VTYNIKISNDKTHEITRKLIINYFKF
jgi:hypothetical protein